MYIPSLKSKTKKLSIESLPDPQWFNMPLRSYKGQMTPVVNKGDYVYKYQLIAQSTDAWSVTLHAPASGYIGELIEINNQQYLQLENDFKNQETESKNTNIDALSKEEILEYIGNSGIVGSGGAGFPTHIKYNTEGYNIEYLIINVVECEPYLSADYALLKEQTEQILQSASFIQKLIGARNIVLAIEKQSRHLQSAINNQCAKLNIQVLVQLMENTYPQGSEAQLIKKITKKELPKEHIPVQHGVVVSNVATVHALGKAIFNGQPLIERIVTLSGEGLAKKGNYRVKIGTPVSHLLQHTNTQWNTDRQQAILGGPMMGKAVISPDETIGKETAGLLLLKKYDSQQYNCIQCGYCSDVCPQRLMPMEFARSGNQNNSNKLKQYNLDLCVECGACAYACPSEVPLMESIYRGKQLIRN